MLHINDQDVTNCVDPQEAIEVLKDAFTSFHLRQAAIQERIRTESNGIKLSTLGAVIPNQGYVGAKVYTTIAGKFQFVILLFSTRSGEPLAYFDAEAITRIRTAACSIIAAQQLANPLAKKLAVIGAGTQGIEHAIQFSKAYKLNEINLYSPNITHARANALQEKCNTTVKMSSISEAIENADIVVTASRSTTALINGKNLPNNCFIAAVGSSMPTSRELDDATLQRASVIAVEWKHQSLQEAGDLVLASPETNAKDKIVELGELLSLETLSSLKISPGIKIYKSVGIGLEDIAIAGLAYEKMQESNQIS